MYVMIAELVRTFYAQWCIQIMSFHSNRRPEQPVDLKQQALIYNFNRRPSDCKSEMDSLLISEMFRQLQQ